MSNLQKQEPLPDYGDDEKSEIAQALKANNELMKDMKMMFQEFMTMMARREELDRNIRRRDMGVTKSSVI